MKFLKRPCICCNCKAGGSKWSKCINRCPKPSKEKSNTVLSRNGGNMSRKMRQSKSLNYGKWYRPCRCGPDEKWELVIKLRRRDFNCGYIDRFGNPKVTGPTVTVIGGTVLTEPANTLFNDPGAEAIDHLGDNLNIAITITPSLDLTIIPYTQATYTFKYSSTDRFGQTSIGIRTVTFN
jgi:hypothetical protein